MPKFTFLCKCDIFQKNDMLFSHKKKQTYQGSLDKCSYRQKKTTILQQYHSFHQIIQKQWKVRGAKPPGWLKRFLKQVNIYIQNLSKPFQTRLSLSKTCFRPVLVISNFRKKLIKLHKASEAQNWWIFSQLTSRRSLDRSRALKILIFYAKVHFSMQM